MSKVTFRDLFDAELLQRESDKKKNTQPAVRGDLFIREPLPVDVEAMESAIVCFVSLSCASCIDLLPELGAFAEGYEGDFILVSSGTEEENNDLIRHFQFSFPVLTMSKEERLQKYASSTTPYAYFLEDGYIMNTAVVDSIQELDALIGRVERNEA
ncbi:hypothetical protein D3P07_19520 [Paenibacillus sp. 1011MAR3C5]|uniref:TlpA family protein disulfide reductase n=1 Tax=Paenibacillus sp. 1011MAR3C5 TaxID=1675787 RepID=UPI000E6B5923|nr:hypothetical protein [Paenibacillus sp. 1011MAR3C5]RJE86264.1 hypothetical protein D3P07_19520 [Paenibacillus sp. 1011MAR3C5]